MERTGFSLQTADFRQFAPNYPEKPAAENRMVGRLPEKPEEPLLACVNCDDVPPYPLDDSGLCEMCAEEFAEIERLGDGL